MKKVSKIISLCLIVAFFSTISITLNGQTNYWCLFGREGEVGTWQEGACIEDRAHECFTCIALDF